MTNDFDKSINLQLRQKEFDSYLDDMRKLIKIKESEIIENKGKSTINKNNRIEAARNQLREIKNTSMVVGRLTTKVNGNKEIELLEKSLARENYLKAKRELSAIKIQVQWKVERFRRILTRRIKAKSSHMIISSESLYMRNLLLGKIKNTGDSKGDSTRKVTLINQVDKKSVLGHSNYDSKLINISQMIFSNTGKAATVQVYWVKTTINNEEEEDADKEKENKEEITSIEVNIVFDISHMVQIITLNPYEVMGEYGLEVFINKIQDLLIEKLEYNHNIRKVVFNRNHTKMRQDAIRKDREEAAAVLIQTHARGMLMKKQYKILLESANKPNRFIYKMIQRYQSLYLEIIFHYLKLQNKMRITGRQFDDHHNKHTIFVDLVSIMSENQYKSMRMFIASRPIGEFILREAFNPIIRIMKRYISIHKEHDEITFAVLFNDEPCKKEIIEDSTIMNFDDSPPKLDPKVDHKIEIVGSRDVQENPTSPVKSKNKLNYINILSKIVMIQKRFRAKKMRDLFGLKKLNKKKINSKTLTYGKLYDKTIKRFGDIFYTICIYKMSFGQDELLNFTAAPFREKIDANNIIKGTYIIDNTHLLNTEGMTLTDFLVNKMRIKEKIINFDLNIDEHFSNFLLLNSL